jgi:steroid Delta-isomerase
MANHQRALNDYVSLYETMSVDDLSHLERFFTSNARFKDPFNDVQGLDKIHRVFDNMFSDLDYPTFSIDEAFLNDDIAYLKWRFNAQLKGKQIAIVGLSRVVFNDQGLVSEHIDYWDASEQFYMKLPVIGAVLRFIQRKVSAS